MCVTVLLHFSPRCVLDETIKIHHTNQTVFNFEVQSFKFSNFDQVIITHTHTKPEMRNFDFHVYLYHVILLQLWPLPAFFLPTSLNFTASRSGQAVFFQSSVLQFWWAPLNFSLFPVLCSQKWHLSWSSTAAAHLLWALTFCAFRVVVTSKYMSYCYLSVSLNRSSFDFWQWDSKFTQVVHEKNLRPAELAPSTMSHSKSLNHISSLSDTLFELQQLVLTITTPATWLADICDKGAVEQV